MWAALPLKPWPPNAISTTTKPSPRRHPVPVVVRALQNRQEEMGGLKSNNEPQHGNAVKSKTKTKPPPSPASAPKEKVEEQRQFSGSDVLMALQRAKKIKHQKRPRDSKTRNNQSTPCFSNTRPLRIKPDWPDRLQELERRLQQLAHA